MFLWLYVLVTAYNAMLVCYCVKKRQDTCARIKEIAREEMDDLKVYYEILN